MKKIFEREHGTLVYDDQGSGPLVVCVPSMGDVRGEYRFLVKQLTAEGYRVISMDIRGMGESSTDWQDYSVRAMGDDLIKVIESINVGPAILIATSISAAAAVWAAVEFPQTVKAMVLIGAFVRGETSAFNRFLYRVAFARPWGPALWAMYYKSLYPSQKPIDFEDYLTSLRQNLNQAGRIESLQKMMPESKSDAEQRADQVRQPVLVLMGSRDPDFKDPEMEAQWAAKTLHGQDIMISGAGHYPHAEMPDLTGPLILSFLRNLEVEMT